MKFEWKTNLITGTNIFEVLTALYQALSNVRGLLFDGDQDVTSLVVEAWGNVICRVEWGRGEMKLGGAEVRRTVI